MKRGWRHLPHDLSALIEGAAKTVALISRGRVFHAPDRVAAPLNGDPQRANLAATFATSSNCRGGFPVSVSAGLVLIDQFRFGCSLTHDDGSTGNFPIPNNNPCAGTPLGLGSNQIQLAYAGPGGARGSRGLNANAGPGGCGVYFPFFDVAGPPGRPAMSFPRGA